MRGQAHIAVSHTKFLLRHIAIAIHLHRFTLVSLCSKQYFIVITTCMPLQVDITKNKHHAGGVNKAMTLSGILCGCMYIICAADVYI
jgi:hypothetical protein